MSLRLMDPSEISFFVVLIILSAIFSGSEIALVSTSPGKVKELLKKKRYGAHFLDKVKSNPHKMLSTILVCNNIVNVAAAAVATDVATRLYGSEGVGIATGAVTLLLLIFGEVTPKSVAIQYAPSFALIMALPIWLLSVLLTPIVWVLEKISVCVNRLFGKSKGHGSITEDELRAMVDISAEEGSIEKQEREFIENVFKLNDIMAEDVMTPRVNVDMLDEHTTIGNALSYINENPHSRIPVYSGNVDNIVGILNVRELIGVLHDGKNLAKTLKEIPLIKPLKIPLTKKISKLFQQFQHTHLHMAIVLDEHGGFAGIVTFEDILEEIVGEIQDEHDENAKLVEKVDRHTVMALGRTELKYVEKALRTEINAEKHDSVNLYILEYLHRFPKQGEEMRIGKLLFRIEEMHNNKIEKVRIAKINKEHTKKEDS